MNIINTAIDGVVIIEPRLFRDARGYFSSPGTRMNSMKRFGLLNSVRTMRVCLLME